MEWKGLATLDEWEVLSKQIAHELSLHGFQKKEIISFMVALEEMYVNIAYYAYSPHIGVVCTNLDIKGNIVSVQFCDTGRPFNPLEAVGLDTAVICKKRKIGGFGIFMACKKTDNMLYEYSDGANKLTLIKKFDKGD